VVGYDWMVGMIEWVPKALVGLPVQTAQLQLSQSYKSPRPWLASMECPHPDSSGQPLMKT